MSSIECIVPQWPAPPTVGAATTTRRGGVSRGAWRSLNLAAHVDDDADAVTENRARLARTLDLPAEPLWLDQVHGTAVRIAGVDTDACADACCGAGGVDASVRDAAGAGIGMGAGAMRPAARS